MKTNEELLAAYDKARANHYAARTGGGFEIELYDRAEEAACAAVLARMAPQWRPISEATGFMPLEGRGAEVLLRAYYPDGRTMSDIYHAWWNREWWARWPHYFQPTHFMPAPPLPPAPSPAPQTGEATPPATETTHA